MKQLNLRLVHLRRKKKQRKAKAKDEEDGEMRFKTSWTKPIGTQMQGKGINGNTMLRPSSSSRLTMADKEEVHYKHSNRVPIS